MAQTLRLAEVAARKECPLLLQGESGSGKEVIARHLHAHSARAQGPFVAVNCGALPSGLIESELFGHRRGAFTGAVDESVGRFRAADGGTLFLDEIGDMPSEAQTRLLRALQEKTISPVGDAREYPVDFRLICATHRDLRAAVRAGSFREDLFYRINVVGIRVPPLRERPMDILPLLSRFLSPLLPPDEMRAALSCFPAEFLDLRFPGNVRELRNLAERYAVLREMQCGWRDAVNPSDTAQEFGPVSVMLPPRMEECRNGTGRNPPARVRNSRLSDPDILRALEACGHHRERAARALGITRRALQYRLAKMARARMERSLP